MVQFNKLRLTGFKSFVDTTELDIGSGLTGIVGPNGCGKSNLVEALRWVMGETSAKRMRGSGMEDVIFSGTSSRPQRNIAEVTLHLDNSSRQAPAELNDSDELEIIRRIERDSGSNYKVNGKTVRARDVQLLFADVSIGANSPALVSQGRVADMINSKPVKRRLILEEAAGISGLHARRHEAELKLRAAENNLTRVEDVMGTMEVQISGLKKQARQASRYRNLSGHIQKAEAIVLHLKWLKESTALETARTAFDEAEGIVREQTQVVTKETTLQTEQAAVVPELREAEAKASAGLQRLRLAYESLEAEERKLEDDKQEAAAQLEQIASDIEHEKTLNKESDESVERLNAERETLESAENSQQDAIKEAAEIKESSRAIVNELDEKLSLITEEVAATETRKRTLEQEETDIEARLLKITDRLLNQEQEYEEISAVTPDKTRLAELAQDIQKLEKTYQDQKQAVKEAENAREEAENAVSDAQDAFQSAQSDFSRLDAEMTALKRLLRSDEEQNYAPVMDDLTVDTGLEKALAVALGDDLQAALDNDAPMYWRLLPDFTQSVDLPKGAEPLSSFVKAPPALHRCLSQIGIVADDETAQRLVIDLKPGQCLVTRDGAAWRWDGLTISTTATNPAAVRLEQRNRLGELDTDCKSAETALEKARTALADTKEMRRKAVETVEEVKNKLQTVEDEFNTLRQEHADLRDAASETISKLAALTEAIEQRKEQKTGLTERLEKIKRELAGLPEGTQSREKLVEIREALTEKRAELSSHQSRLDQITREAESRQNRLQAIGQEIASWQSRQERVSTRLNELSERQTSVQETVKLLENKPAEIQKKRAELLDQITDAEKQRDETADALASAEGILNEIQIRLRDAERLLSDAREKRAMAQANVTTVQHTMDGIQEQITEKFSCAPDALLETFEIDGENLPAIDAIQTKLERLIRERENMGPVNLRAEVEVQELTEQIDTMTTEKDDLIAAITRLRQGISKLNRQAREKLLKAFDEVDKHFQELFTRLFAGGRAHLALTDADDPLEAGLEIYAQPPGKKLQVLSLLSGGEQTLTSIALIFAMFMTNPAPICVLDEIDAPLDDSNVDRVCSLLEEIVKRADTRFIIITHHRMTMARMDRLYGVTMGEKGVSQLVSVDLKQGDLLAEVA